ncbi:MAG: ribose-5-phosphate isomerase [Candidatus Taylorbacteria bacterium RIFCSPLOWO2_02_FULL_43_11]|uniref:Ribose-5-phosphate isomerase n=1 Tax=Candidatus Taylorbacteria bacterium RIFCSPHIGHO2_02_FULL_43_32b TaxID=1802306 RepID=A0A1G2MK07_9BACT|nr:MAG: ribose-5-phosphate isomerase [Candidatus Taylorbacteria bacterium RIFCSPHIGHO2_01_FULL_43_47]OHA24265.1 MAG: ribose-5-phosphate isomerase [Candidatus Taylorbacteria bacterium RIFCSPHIGHO2_02_FULL_43_32b]OHA31382.1 MAG: ribose-5-phosphate isomerase [Candidatus Taylorbacteria bacterium RIFCSPLOWO2_01_FULL_43_44]OHA36578.1 MAG: ribose-5-phosphate isomerase [Candidatus Taylorbacteria bacterium RIFCSPLOWO2_02_FULL_43_11]
MRIFIGADHAGFELKEQLKKYVSESGHEVTDFGAHEFKEGDDYPDYVIPVAKAVAGDPRSRGIIIGGSGQGEAICANRFSGVRAVVFNGPTYAKVSVGKQYKPDGTEIPDEIKLSREHNDANVLSLGARFLSIEEAKSAVKTWLETPFSNDERHIRRIKKIDDIAH